MSTMHNKIITKEHLENNPHHVFVFGDNTLRRGYGGAAKLRDMPNAYGFITKKRPNNNLESFYIPEEYITIYLAEIDLLRKFYFNQPGITLLISPLGSGLANRFGIFDEVIAPNIRHDLGDLENVVYLWD